MEQINAYKANIQVRRLESCNPGEAITCLSSERTSTKSSPAEADEAMVLTSEGRARRTR